LPGNSGGPLLNSNGEFFSVMQGTHKDENKVSNGYTYKGNEDSTPMAYHSLSPTCQTVAHYIMKPMYQYFLKNHQKKSSSIE
jgi:hypothetical protein